MISLDRKGDVFILTMDEGENRWTTNFVRAIAEKLDDIEATNGPAALVTTSANEKFFSNGLDLDWRRGEGDGAGGDRGVFAQEFMGLMARMITFSVPTIAAINGHGFGAGFMFALCHDVRVMRADRGFLCANEIQLGMEIPDAELALFRHKLSGSAFFETVQLARRWTGPDAQTAGFVAATAAQEDLIELAITQAAKLAPLGKNRALYGRSKERLYGEAPSINLNTGAAFLLRNHHAH